MSELLTDTGFASAEAVHKVLRRWLLRDRLEAVRTSATELLDLIEQGIEPDAGEMAALICERSDLTDSDLAGSADNCRIALIDSHQKREKELLEGVNLTLHFLDAISVGFRHGLFSLEDVARARRAIPDGHSLCEGGK